MQEIKTETNIIINMDITVDTDTKWTWTLQHDNITTWTILEVERPLMEEGEGEKLHLQKNCVDDNLLISTNIKAKANCDR